MGRGTTTRQGGLTGVLNRVRSLAARRSRPTTPWQTYRRQAAPPTSDLRILVAGPPKTGNMWIKCLLANIYDLHWLEDRSGYVSKELDELRRFLAAGEFPPGTIFHRHYSYSADLVELARSAPFHLVSMIRNPYDLFVSSYYHHRDRTVFAHPDGPRAAIANKPIDDPAVLAYLEREFGAVLEKANGWLQHDGSIVVRYEDLLGDPIAELNRVTNLIRPVEPVAIERAVATCQADTMRQAMPKHVRAATVGDSKQRLGPEHLAIFRERHAALIRDLGYEVR